MNATSLDPFLKSTLNKDSIDQQITKKTIDYNSQVLKQEQGGANPLYFMDYIDPTTKKGDKKKETNRESAELFQNTLYSDPFWYEEPNILWQQNRLLEFVPNDKMTMIEKLNAIVRFSLYTSILFIFFLKKYQAVWFPLLVMAFTVWFYQDSKNRIETYLTTENLPDKEFYQNFTKSKQCTLPTYENPMMNANLITDPRDRAPACKTWDNPKVEEDMNDKLNYNLYRDVSDVWDKMTLKRTFYTMPATTIPNDQNSFAKWCYNTAPTCKEKTAYCASPLWPPSIKQNLDSMVNPI